MAESLHCSPKSISTLLIAYTSVQNRKFLNKKFFIKKIAFPFSITMISLFKTFKAIL